MHSRTKVLLYRKDDPVLTSERRDIMKILINLFIKDLDIRRVSWNRKYCAVSLREWCKHAVSNFKIAAENRKESNNAAQFKRW